MIHTRHHLLSLPAAAVSFGLGVVLAAVSLVAPSRAVETKAPTVVVELFTSQSCSSCPPADAFLGTLAKKPGLIALSLHVTYWNYLGWKDNLSSKAATRRQKAYRWSLRQSMIYTPQIIVHGRHPAVGSNIVKVADAILKVREAARPSVPIVVSVADGKLRVSLAAAKAVIGAAPADVMLFLIDNSHTRKIGGGENAGRTITYTNVVRDIRRLGAYKGDEAVFTANPRGAKGARRDKAVVLVQGQRVGPIYGAAMITLP